MTPLESETGIGYKYTNADRTTYGECVWEVGEWKTSSGEGELCTAGWLHAYEHPLLAELHNPIHGKYRSDALLWRVEYGGNVLRDGQMKFGATRMRLVEQVDRPQITTTQAVAYAILCAKAVCANPKLNAWADGWLSGNDRSAYAAYYAAYARAAYAYAACAAARAVDARAARAVDARAAYARAAYACAAYAARAALGDSLNLLALAQQAMEVTE